MAEKKSDLPVYIPDLLNLQIAFYSSTSVQDIGVAIIAEGIWGGKMDWIKLLFQILELPIIKSFTRNTEQLGGGGQRLKDSELLPKHLTLQILMGSPLPILHWKAWRRSSLPLSKLDQIQDGDAPFYVTHVDEVGK